jgi:hypothetical protein
MALTSFLLTVRIVLILLAPYCLAKCLPYLLLGDTTSIVFIAYAFSYAEAIIRGAEGFKNVRGVFFLQYYL